MTNTKNFEDLDSTRSRVETMRNQQEIVRCLYYWRALLKDYKNTHTHTHIDSLIDYHTSFPNPRILYIGDISFKPN